MNSLPPPRHQAQLLEDLGAAAAYERVDRNWWRISTIVSIVCVLLSPLVISFVSKNDKQDMVFIEQGQTGALRVLDARVVTDFKASRANIEFDLENWLLRLQRAQQESIRQDLKDSGTLLLESAVPKFRELVERESLEVRLREQTGFRREVQIRTTTFPSDSSALIFYTLIDRQSGNKTAESAKVAEVKFSIDPNRSDTPEKRRISVIGLRIADFDIRNDGTAR